MKVPEIILQTAQSCWNYYSRWSNHSFGRQGIIQLLLRKRNTTSLPVETNIEKHKDFKFRVNLFRPNMLERQAFYCFIQLKLTYNLNNTLLLRSVMGIFCVGPMGNFFGKSFEDESVNWIEGVPVKPAQQSVRSKGCCLR